MNLLFWAATVVLGILSVMPLSKLPYGMIRGAAFPRQQYVVIAAVLIGLVLLVNVQNAAWIIGVLLSIIAVQLVYIVKFSPLWRAQVGNATIDLRQKTERHISILSANVKMSNRQYAKLIDLAHEQLPDVILAMETDSAWVSALRNGLGQSYPHTITRPQDNGYGLCVFSRLALSDVTIKDLVTRNVPSIETSVTLRTGEQIRLFVLHPEPPVANHDTIGRDGEIALVGLKAKVCTLPAIVAGDLNDVAWSTTTRRFQRLSGLLDPRVGRGFYNTFHADVAFLRWPLDHLFHDARFALLRLERLRHIGSDHFPMLFELALAGSNVGHDQITPAAPQEKHAVKQMIKTERNRARAPIGEDWEND